MLSMLGVATRVAAQMIIDEIAKYFHGFHGH